MGLFQKALETYDTMERFAGIYEEGKAEPLAPIAHIVTKAQIEITITADGKLVSINQAEKDKKIIIPVTEESAGRTSSPAAHPLCEQLGYLLEDDAEKHALYMDGLQKWVQSAYSHPKAQAVLQYMESGTLRTDLNVAQIPKTDEKIFVCWRVVGLGEDSGPVWTDVSLMKAYAAYYLSTREEAEKQICMLTGEECYTTWQHLKGAFSLNGNAKLISANDHTNYTYRGRFLEAEEAASVGYVASQKAHNALKWLVGTQGTVQGNRAFVCWNPHGLMIPQPTLSLGYQVEEEACISDWKDYHADLQKRLQGYRTQENWNENEEVVIAAFDAATTGRLAVTYYNELPCSDFLDRLVRWEESCCWKDSRWGILSPSLYNIIRFAFGTLRQTDGLPEVDKKLAAQQVQRLIACRIDQAAFPTDVMRAMVIKANQMQLYGAKRTQMLLTACAVIRKYHIDHFKEEFQLALEPERNDRSYQWGRMLAIVEKIERDTYSNGENRETNAIRMQSVFVRRPAYAFDLVMTKLKTAYYPQLQPGQRVNYDRLIGEVMEQLSQHMNEYENPLTETYLLGYYLQKNALYTKKNVKETEEE